MAVMPDLAQHIVKSFEQELKQLNGMLVEMGGMLENQLAAAANAVIAGDNASAQVAMEQDPSIDALEREVEQLVIRMLALRQPLAGDLRQIVSSLKISSDLERIGDYAANVAKRSIVLNQFNLPFKLGGMTHLARLVQENLKLTIDVIGDSDSGKAIQVWRADQAVDDIYTAIFRELITYMMEDPRNITPCTHLLFIAKNLERIGDHTTNIAETVHYAVTGEVLPEGRPKGENSSYTIVRHKER
jgi:phosphate transport system protein